MKYLLCIFICLCIAEFSPDANANSWIKCPSYKDYYNRHQVNTIFNGEYLVTSSDEYCWIMDISTGNLKKIYRELSSNRLKYFSNDKEVFALNKDTLYNWDFETNELEEININVNLKDTQMVPICYSAERNLFLCKLYSTKELKYNNNELVLLSKNEPYSISYIKSAWIGNNPVLSNDGSRIYYFNADTYSIYGYDIHSHRSNEIYTLENRQIVQNLVLNSEEDYIACIYLDRNKESRRFYELISLDSKSRIEEGEIRDNDIDYYGNFTFGLNSDYAFIDSSNQLIVKSLNNKTASVIYSKQININVTDLYLISNTGRVVLINNLFNHVESIDIKDDTLQAMTSNIHYHKDILYARDNDLVYILTDNGVNIVKASTGFTLDILNYKELDNVNHIKQYENGFAFTNNSKLFGITKTGNKKLILDHSSKIIDFCFSESNKYCVIADNNNSIITYQQNTDGQFVKLASENLTKKILKVSIDLSNRINILVLNGINLSWGRTNLTLDGFTLHDITEYDDNGTIELLNDGQVVQNHELYVEGQLEFSLSLDTARQMINFKYSDDGKYLIGDFPIDNKYYDRGILLWDTKTHKSLRFKPREFEGVFIDDYFSVYHLNCIISPDNKRFVMASSNGLLLSDTIDFNPTSVPGKDIDEEQEIYFKLRPNPASDFIVVSSAELQDATEIRIISLNGNLISKYNWHGTHDFPLDIQGISPGCYFIQIVNKNQKYISKAFIKQ